MTGEGMEGYSTSCIHWSTDTKTIGWEKEKTLGFYLHLPQQKRSKEREVFPRGANHQASAKPLTELTRSWSLQISFCLL